MWAGYARFSDAAPEAPTKTSLLYACSGTDPECRARKRHLTGTTAAVALGREFHARHRQ